MSYLVGTHGGIIAKDYWAVAGIGSDEDVIDDGGLCEVLKEWKESDGMHSSFKDRAAARLYMAFKTLAQRTLSMVQVTRLTRLILVELVRSLATTASYTTDAFW